MAIAKKNRFKKQNIKLDLNLPSAPFPPDKIVYDDMKLVNLGKSNKEDLFPVSIEDPDLMKASISGNIGQYIYSNQNSDLYDVLLYIDEGGDVIMHGIKTRLL